MTISQHSLHKNRFIIPQNRPFSYFCTKCFSSPIKILHPGENTHTILLTGGKKIKMYILNIYAFLERYMYTKGENWKKILTVISMVSLLLNLLFSIFQISNNLYTHYIYNKKYFQMFLNPSLSGFCADTSSCIKASSVFLRPLLGPGLDGFHIPSCNYLCTVSPGLTLAQAVLTGRNLTWLIWIFPVPHIINMLK